MVVMCTCGDVDGGHTIHGVWVPTRSHQGEGNTPLCRGT